MNNRILIFEPLCTGHHFKYVQLLIRAFTEKKCKIYLASTTESFETKEYEILLKNIEHLFTKVITSVKMRNNIYLNSLLHSIEIQRLIKRYDCNIVFIPYLDTYFYTLGILLKLSIKQKKRTIEGIIFRGDCSYEGMSKNIRNRIRRIIMEKILLSNVFNRVLYIDELMYESFKHVITKANTHIVSCPDPVESTYMISRNEFRSKFGISHNDKVLGVFGMIDSRKGVDLLLEAFQSLPKTSYNKLLLMGKHSEKLNDCVRKIELFSNIISVDRFVTDDELISGINSVDVVAVVYPGHIGSASIVIRAAAAQKPVLGSDFGWIGHTIKKYRLGKACNVLDEDSLIEGVKWAFDCPSFDSEKAREFAEKNTIERFMEVVSQDIRD